MKGGLFINPNNVENIVINYLENSDIRILSRGAYGITFKTSLRQNIPEYFLNLDVGNNFKQNVRELVVKLCVINVNNDEKTEKKYYKEQKYEKLNTINQRTRQFIKDRLNISPINRDEFIEEVNIQTDIYLKTVTYLQPLCPGIAYTNIIIDNRIDNTGTSINEKILKLLRIPINNTIIYGIIVMELAKDYNTMHSILTKLDEQNPQPKEIRDYRFNIILIGFFMLIQLALETGYTHGDFHNGNMMVNENYDTYFYNTPIRMLIIDFGRTIKIPQLQMNMFRERCNNKQYLYALQILCNKPVANEYVANRQFNRFYGWVCDVFNYGMFKITTNNEKEKENEKRRIIGLINNSIETLFIKRERQININIETMKDLHEQITEYPLMPLSNSAKNNLFSGFIENIRLDIEEIEEISNGVDQIRRQEPLDWSFAPGLTPGQQATTPGQQATTPGQQATTPIQQATTPGQQATTPIQQIDPPQIQRRKPIKKERQRLDNFGGKQTNKRKIKIKMINKKKRKTKRNKRKNIKF